MKMSGQLHAAATLLQGKIPGARWIWGWVGLNGFEEVEILSWLLEFEHRIVQPVV